MTLQPPLHVPLEQYDPNVPRTAHSHLAAVLYGEILKPAESVLNVAAGNTELARDLYDMGMGGPSVTSLDAMEGYGDRRSDRVHGLAQAMPFEDGKFSMTLCQFAAQHMTSEVLGGTIREMVHVTQRADSEEDGTKGVILLNPVFRQSRLEKLLQEAGLGDVAGVTEHERAHIPVDQRRLVYPTLWIHKHDGLTEERLQVLTNVVAGSDAMKPTRRSLGELAVRVFGGHSTS